MTRTVRLALIVLALGACAARDRTELAPLPPSRVTPELVARLRAHVDVLAGQIGPRCETRLESRARAAEYVRAELAAAGLAPEVQRFGAPEAGFANVAVEPRDGAAAARLVVGAHYDTVCGSPGADDDASGVAVLIELARIAGPLDAGRWTRFIAFTNEEKPFSRTADRGSRVAARASRERGEDLVGMISLEMVGYYRDSRASQKAPPGVELPAGARGNFIALVANRASSELLRAAIGRFRGVAALRAEGLATSSVIVSSISRSDHSEYWGVGFPALMVTDTADLRNPHYHLASDTPDTLDYARMAEVTLGMVAVVAGLAQPAAP